MRYLFVAAMLLLFACSQKKQAIEVAPYTEQHRPQIHFSPRAGWMNDPNGMVYYKDTWHLFYQYYPDSTVWGPMHWGHATSKDLVHWQEQMVALEPDSLGYIFSGSVVADTNNTSGFGQGRRMPLVAIFTQHDPKGEKEHRINFQNQSIAFSVDEGKRWIKYAGNPVLRNTGNKDFRDPKVSWNSTAKKWIMTLAVKDRVHFYSSPDLKQWTKESEFGETSGAHGGVWECPDLFPLQDGDKTVWVLLVSINPGGPAGGSATQYFIGDFDGKAFHTKQKEARWIDQGTDDYAGVTFANTGNRRVFIGWMSNWQYAQVVPTTTWRSAMTVPRQLSVTNIGGEYYLRSLPARELASNMSEGAIITDSINAITLHGPRALGIIASAAQNVSITLFNSQHEKCVIGYDQPTNSYYIDRTQSGKTDFKKSFATKTITKRIGTGPSLDLFLLIDDASVELFADKGLNTMTSIFFPHENYHTARIIADKKVDTVMSSQVYSIWR